MMPTRDANFLARSFELALALTLASAFAACGPATGDEPSAEPTADAPEADGPTNRVDIPATVRRNLGITFATVAVRDVAGTLRVPGAFEVQPQARREYRMALPGTVELLVDQYDAVEPGSPLYRYRSPAWPELLHELVVSEEAIATAKAELAVDRATVAEAQAKLAIARGRVEALARADLRKAELEATAGELEASLPRLRAEVELAQAHLAGARRTRSHALHRLATATGFTEAALEEKVAAGGNGGSPRPRYATLDWIEVRALQEGVVEGLAVTSGAFVEPTGAVLSTIDPARVRFRAQALQADLPRLFGRTEARIVPPQTPGLAATAAVPARLALGLEAHPDRRTVDLLATPQVAADWIRPGVSAFLEVVVESSEGPALAVPRAAIVQDGLQHVLFRRDPSNPDQAIRVEADMGVDDGRWVVLNSGVMRGDAVVLEGAYELKLATQQRGGGSEAGHFHADGSFHDEH